MAKVYDQPAEYFENSMVGFPPELASPAAIYLAHESCPLNGVMLVCGGGQVLRLAFSENEGFRSDDMSPEAIAGNVDEIIDMSAALPVGLGSAEKTTRDAAEGTASGEH
jgi:hypothetical protein